MKQGSLLIISNDFRIGNQIQDKIKLLRECDIIKIVSYIEAISVLNSTQPSIIIVYCSNSDSIGIIKEIRAIKSLNKVPIIFVTDTFTEEKLMYAFDNGIDDFFFLSDADSIILMRIFLTLQKSILYRQIDTNNEILVSANIIDKQTGLYKKEQANNALGHFFGQSLEENSDNTIFMCIKPVTTGNKKINITEIAKEIKSAPRGNDIVAYGRGADFYLILYDSGISGAKAVASRIRNKLQNKCKIYAIAAEITASFEEMEPVLYRSLKDQISAGIEFNYLYNLSFNEAAQVMDIRDENGKRFKDFKKEFFENIETIIAPVFYQMQSLNSGKYPEAKIDYTVSETESKFSIREEDIESEIQITYPAYTKLLIDIKHSEGDKAPEIRRLSYDFEDFTDKLLTSIITNVIQEFADKKNLKMINITETK